MSWTGIGENLLSDLIFVVLAVGIAWLFYLVTNRHKLMRFFFYKKATFLKHFFKPLPDKRIRIYTSKITIPSPGSIGTGGKKYSYVGHASPLLEVLEAGHLKNLFSYMLPSLTEDIPRLLRILRIVNIDAEVKPSPEDEDSIEDKIETDATIITIGSPAYNRISAYVEKHLESQVRFESGRIGPRMHLRELGGSSLPNRYEDDLGRENSAGFANAGTACLLDPHINDDPRISEGGSLDYSEYAPDAEPTISSGTSPESVFVSPRSDSSSEAETQMTDHRQSTNHSPSTIQVEGLDPIADTNVGVVERVIDSENERYIYYVAGLSEMASAGAAYYLATRWRKLKKTYDDDKPFVLLLRFHQDDYKKLISTQKMEN